MRIPVRHIVDNLIWTTHGTVWAIWRLSPVPVVHAGARQREELLAWTTALIRQLAGAPRIFGLCAATDAAAVIARMVEGIDLEANPAWAEVATATLDLLEGVSMSERTHWLATPLAAPSGRFRLSLGAAGTELGDLLGLRPAPVTAVEVAAYRARATQLAAQLATGLVLRPARPAEIVWMYQHCLHRGLDEPLLATAATAATGASRLVGDTLRSPSYAQLGQARVCEGGLPQAQRRGPWWKTGAPSPLHRRWLQVETPAGTCYQALLALAEMPATWAFPGGDWLAQLDLLPFDVDYTVDLRIVPAAKAAASARHKIRELVDQADQYDGERAGVPGSLHEAAVDLREMRDRLSATSTEVEVQSITTLAVWADSPAECDNRAETLRGALGAMDYQLVRAAGAQLPLFTLMLPGTPTHPTVREFTQHQLSTDWAMSGAFASAAVGDPSGAMVGVNLNAGTVRPVLLDLADAPRTDASASMGVVGEPGAGKSVLMKTQTSAVVDRGGRAIVIDRTPLREWARFAAEAAPGRAQIIDAAAAAISIDPLRIFGGPVGAHYATAYLSLQLGVGAMSPAGLVLDAAVKRAVAQARPSMAAVIAELEAIAAADARMSRAETAADAADLLRIIADNPLAAMVFDPALPPARLDGDFVVFTTTGLTLPPREVFASAELMAQQPLEALIGRAVLYLIAAIARQVAFADPLRFCAIALDECYWLTNSAEGQALVLELVRDGRKHGAGVLLGSHDAADFGDATIQGLLAYKALLRHTDAPLARRGLTFLGLDGDDEELIKLVTTELSPVGQRERAGEALLRDARRRIGRIKVLIPQVARLADSVRTTPVAAPGHGAR